MLRRPAGNKLGLLGFRSLVYCNPISTYPHAVLPRFQSDWRRKHEADSDEHRDNSVHPNAEREQSRDLRDFEKQRRERIRFPLEVDSLGKPGEIVVMPSLGRKRRRRKPGNELEATNETRDTISSILGDLDDEKSLPSETSIQQRIEEMRGSYQMGETIPDLVFEQLRTQLAASFTFKQLSDYIAEYDRNTTVDDKGWTWGPSQGKGPGTAEKLKGKALLAEMIARDRWQLVVAAEFGRLEFHIPARLMSLLRHAGHFSFHELASLHGCGIDITHKTGLVALTGKRGECEHVREIIMDATARACEDAVGIYSYTDSESTSQIFTADFLQWVNKTYGVFVERRPHKIPEKILYLAENKLGAENARRTLNLALSNTTSLSTPFSTYLPSSELASIYHHTPGAHASWFEKQNPWFRWAMSSSQHEKAEAQETPFFDKHQTRLSDELLRLLRVDGSKAGLAAGLHESVTAVVGKCLFMEESSFEAPAVSPAQLGALSLPRIFTTDTPWVSRFIEKLSPITANDEVKVYRLRLSPTSNAGSLPELEFEVSMNPSLKYVDFRTLKAIKSTNSVDYLLPENGLDLRFTRTVSQDLLLKPSSPPEHMQGLSEQLSHEHSLSPEIQAMLQSLRDSVQSTFVSGETSQWHVPAPTFCNVSLPRELIQQPTSRKVKLVESGEPTSENSVTVEYMFQPLNDVRGALVRTYDFDGRPLDYRYYASGPFLASRTNEVSLGMDIPQADSAAGSDQSELLEHEFHSFYNAACDMAFQIHGGRDVD
ncbi:uncharacterized protein N7515_006949 [Penicillium bovifimosum]|uniref:Mitochondrial inner-membrane-bound regulator-domain-containing protein n=1 Tax=Penicillium bovifimosum TaxID=126998 RepID=A0A9W9L1N1_9EURO|nr:uncharacterized protein N7515_006949 [Penicillium bovifimosum]KAJ5130910.1 hypothetical protein N7515_006949 [Penicillium bovifimosum]